MVIALVGTLIAISTVNQVSKSILSKKKKKKGKGQILMYSLMQGLSEALVDDKSLKHTKWLRLICLKESVMLHLVKRN
jgi:hypothetical protein